MTYFKLYYQDGILLAGTKMGDIQKIIFQLFISVMTTMCVTDINSSLYVALIHKLGERLIQIRIYHETILSNNTNFAQSFSIGLRRQVCDIMQSKAK